MSLLASRPQRPQDAHAPGAALQAGNARPWPMAGYIHPRHHCAVASLVHRLFSSSVDALESQVQFCWQDAHGERHEACTRVCEEKFSVFDQNFVQNKGPPKRNLGFKIRGQTEKSRTPQAPRKARCTQPRRLGEPTGHVQHTCIPHRTTPRAHRRRTQSRTPHRHRRPHTNRQPLVHPPPLVPNPSLGPRRLTTLCPPSLAHRRWLGELG